MNNFTKDKEVHNYEKITPSSRDRNSQLPSSRESGSDRGDLGQYKDRLPRSLCELAMTGKERIGSQ